MRIATYVKECAFTLFISKLHFMSLKVDKLEFQNGIFKNQGTTNQSFSLIAEDRILVKKVGIALMRKHENKCERA